MNIMDQALQRTVRAAGPHETIFGPGRRPDTDHDPALLSLAEGLRVLRRGWRSIALWLILCCGAAILYLSVTPPTFVGTSLVILEARRASTGADISAAASATLDSAQAESQLQVVKSERILSVVFDRLDLAHASEFANQAPGWRERSLATIESIFPALKDRLPPLPPPSAEERQARAFQSFTDRVSVRRIGQSYVLEISYRAPTAAEAARLTNSITAAYISDQIDLKAAAAKRGAEFLQERLAVLKDEQDAAAVAIRDGVVPAMHFPDSDARIISAARVPLGKSYPQTMLLLVFAAVCGLFIGCAVIIVRHSFERTIRTAHQVWRLFNLECLGEIPLVRQRRGNIVPYDLIVTCPESPFAGAVRAAHTAIVSGTREGQPRCIGLVSCHSREGTSTLAANLAYFLASAGNDAILVDADLQHPTLSRALVPEAGLGLSEALVHPADLAKLTSTSVSPGLAVIPAKGRFEPDTPNRFLGSPQMGQLLDRLRQEGSVIIDLPALADTSHAQAIGRLLDAVVIVVACGRTTTDDLAKAVRSLEGAGANLAGVILNRPFARSKA